MSLNAQHSEEGQVLSVEEQQQQQEQQQGVEQVAEMARGNESILRRHMRYDPLAVLFIILLLVGGVVAYITKQSVYSLVASTAFAILLAFGTYLEGARKNAYPLLMVFFALGSMMSYRYYVKEVFMPSGLVALLSLFMFARHSYLLYLRRKQPTPSHTL